MFMEKKRFLSQSATQRLGERTLEIGGRGAEGLVSQGGQFGAWDGEEVAVGGPERLRRRVRSEEFTKIEGSRLWRSLKVRQGW